MAKGSLKGFLSKLVRSICVFIAVLCIIELVAYALYLNPPKKDAWILAAQEFYRTHEGDIIQYKSDCAQFDPTVSYTLKPGECDFENREFETKLGINSLGLRDDEASLQAPEVIVLGDSFAMGWGVEQEEPFPQLLEQKLGVKVLNAGISSFGTARESILLNRLDTSNLKLLIVQYNENDVAENKKFISNGLEIKTMDKRSYVITKHRLNDRIKPYRFGLYFSDFFPEIVKQKERLAVENSNNPEFMKKRDRGDFQEAKYFHRILSGCLTDLSAIPIVVIELNNHGANDSGFSSHLEHRMLEEKASNEFKRLDIHPLDVTAVLPKSLYYTHDAHIFDKGHQVVADLLSDYIESNKWLK